MAESSHHLRGVDVRGRLSDREVGYVTRLKLLAYNFADELTVPAPLRDVAGYLAA
jgi:hypothetical protein